MGRLASAIQNKIRISRLLRYKQRRYKRRAIANAHMTLIRQHRPHSRQMTLRELFLPIQCIPIAGSVFPVAALLWVVVE